VREGFLGDLEERFQREAAHDPGAARRRYWREALSPSLLGLRREVRGMPLPAGAHPTHATGDGLVRALLQDARFALRMLVKQPAFTAVAVVSLALGIGPNTAIFSLVDSLLLTDWGVEDPETVLDVYSLTDEGRYFYTYYGVYELVQEGGEEIFRDVAASAQYSGNVETGGRAELLLGELVTGNYFDVLGVEAARGRTFLPEEDATPGTHPVVVVSDRFWRTRHDADPALVGSEIRLNGRSYTVVGIAPPAFRGRVAPGIGTDFWAPLRMYPHLAPSQMGNGNLLITARLAPGVTGDRARSVLDAVATRFNESRPERRSELELAAVTLDEILLHPNMDGFLRAVTALLFAAVGLVLLVACVNLAGFLLSRATDRRKEMAIRVAMGAGRRDILRQLLVESLLLAALGGALGLALGVGVVRLLAGMDLPLDVPVVIEAGLNGRVLLFTAGASVAAALLFGLTPALEAMRAPVAPTLRDEGRGSGSRRGGTARGVLVAGQMALSTVLLVGAGLFLRSLQEATAMEVGFDTGPAAVVTVEAWASDLTPEEQTAFAGELFRRVREMPDVRTAGLTTRLPLDLGVTNRGFTIPGVEPPPDRDRWILELAYVSPGYFETMGIRRVEGRTVEDRDRAGERPVVVVTRAAAERFWPGESAVGRVLHRDGDPEDQLHVVGVVEDARIWSLTEPPRPYLYVPAAQGYSWGRYHVVARGDGSPAALAGRIRDAAESLEPRVFVSDVGTMDQHLAFIYFLPRLAALALLLVGGLAVVMACVGLYGMVGYSVARRTREMGIRMALGAERGRVVALVVRKGLLLVAVGGAVGLGLALATGSLVEGFLIGVSGLDPAALLGAPLLLAVLAGVAAWLPARRAAAVDPVEALRSE
jgi:predicted permease